VQINGEELISDSPHTILLPSGAELTIDPATGEFTYDPNGAFGPLKPGESFQDSFTYVIEDPSGLESNVATATIVVNGSNDPVITGVNNPPVAVDDDYTASFADPTVSSHIMANDFDIDVGDNITIDHITIPAEDGGSLDVRPSDDGSITATFPSGGVVTINNVTGEMDYDATDVIANIPIGETFVETFTYVIVDETGQTAMATVTITIEGNYSPQPVSPPPDQPDDSPQFVNPPPDPDIAGEINFRKIGHLFLCCILLSRIYLCHSNISLH